MGFFEMGFVCLLLQWATVVDKDAIDLVRILVDVRACSSPNNLRDFGRYERLTDCCRSFL